MNRLLLITLQRAGSTVLFDALRYSPKFTVEADWRHFAALGVGESRRRYPRDLSQTEGRQDHRIEVTPGNWVFMETIPALAERDCHHQGFTTIEKIHPHFVGFSLRKVTRYLNQGPTAILLLSRRPSDAIYSFIRYQRRNVGWYEGYSALRTIIHYYRELRFMRAIVKRIGAPVYWTSFDSLMSNFADELEKIYTLCGYGDDAQDARRYGNHVQNTLLSGKRERLVFQGSQVDRSILPSLPPVLVAVIRALDKRHDKYLEKMRGTAI